MNKPHTPDNFKMPFGKYGPMHGDHREIGKVPAEYLDWLRGQTWLHKFPDVALYIEQNGNVINAELSEKDND